MIKLSIGLLLVTLGSFGGALECKEYYGNRRGLERTVLPLTPVEQNLKIIPVNYVLPVLNQGPRGFCWLYTAYENLVNRSILRTGKNPEVSIFYLSYYHWLERAIESSVNLNSSSVEEGGYIGTATDLMKKVGVITDKQWKEIGGSTTINLPAESAKDDPQVRALMQKSHLDKQLLVDWLKPNVNISANPKAFEEYYENLYGSKNFLPLMEAFLQQKARLAKKNGATAFDLGTINMMRNAIRDRIAPPYFFSLKDLNSIIERVDHDIASDMTRLFNRIYFGKDTNPIEERIDRRAAQQRAHELFPEVNQPVVYFFASNNRKHETNVNYRDDVSRQVTVSIETLKRIVRAFHESNHAVMMVYDHQKDFVQTNSDGILSLRHIKHWPVSPYIKRRAREYDDSVRYNNGNHLALSIGTYTHKKDEDKVAGFLLRNSWGEKSGRNGDLIMDESFFGSFIINISVFAEDLKSPKIRALLGPDLLKELTLE